MNGFEPYGLIQVIYTQTDSIRNRKFDGIQIKGDRREDGMVFCLWN